MDLNLPTISRATANNPDPDATRRWCQHAAYHFPELEEAITALAIGWVAGLDVLFEGPPGTGKTALTTAFSGAVGASLFERSLSAWTDVETLLGPVDIGALQQGKYQRHSAGMMNDCDWVFLDELPRAGRGVRDLILRSLSGRKLSDGTPVKARTITAAANKPLTDEDDLALADRFSLVVRFEKIRDDDKRMQAILADGAPVLNPVTLPDPSTMDAVNVPQGIAQAIKGMSAEMGSVRRWKAAVRGCKAHALLRGSVDVDWDDIRTVLPLAIPGSGDEDGERRERIEALINEYAPEGDAALLEFQALCDSLIEIGEVAPKDRTQDQSAAYDKRWVTIEDALATLKSEHPQVADLAQEAHKDARARDRKIMKRRMQEDLGDDD